MKLLTTVIVFFLLCSPSLSSTEYLNSSVLLDAPKYYFAEAQNRLQRSSGFVFQGVTMTFVAEEISKLTDLKVVVDSKIKDVLVSFILNGTAGQALITAAAQAQAFVNIRNGYLEISTEATFLYSLQRPFSHRDLQDLFYLIEGSPSVLYVDSYKLKATLDYPTFMKFRELVFPMRIEKSTLLFEDSF